MMTKEPHIKTGDTILNIAAYKFCKLTCQPERRERLRELTKSFDLKGTILLSSEGINLFIAGSRESIKILLNDLRIDPEIGEMEVKESFSDYQPFSRMLVKLKNEIIAFGVDGIDPVDSPADSISAKELKQWLDEGKPCMLLDVRNDYEIDLGTFENAVPIGLDHFRDFPEAVDKLPEDAKQIPVVMFCTGGIRCEKAGPFMDQAGFEHIYQLDGGILKYFEECGSAHYEGDCFVFDKRVALDANLQETSTTFCFACQHTLLEEDQASPDYVVGKTCPFCIEKE